MSTLTPQAVAILATLADRAFAAEKARLGAAARRLADARAALLAHEADGARVRAGTDLAADPPADPPADPMANGLADAGALARWGIWHRGRVEMLRARIAAAEAALVPLRTAAARAFGRTRAVEHLADLARAEAALRAERAAERLALAPQAARPTPRGP